MLLFQPPSSSPSLQNSTVHEGDELQDCAFPLQGAISEWQQERAAAGPSLLGVLLVTVTNANSLAMSLAKPKTYILIFS